MSEITQQDDKICLTDFKQIKQVAKEMGVSSHCLWLHQLRYEYQGFGKTALGKPYKQGHLSCRVCGAYHRDGGME